MKGHTVVYGDFEWNSAKAESNEKKHGVTFEEAATAFGDDHAEEFTDDRHEDRFTLIGMSSAARVLYVVHCQRVSESGNARTRIISARIARKSEAIEYALGDALS